MSALTRAEKLELLALLEEQQHRAEGNRLRVYRAYPKQAEFHTAGATYRERLLKAGNQLGKTWSAAFETAMHLSGRYPDWWQGKAFDHAVSGWAAGVTNEVTRDSLQLLLCGKIDHVGTGAIPRDAIKEWSRRVGVRDAIETIVVRWGGGGDIQAGESVLGIKSYEQGRQKFQASTLDLVWLDEEPPLDIYTECLTRTNATAGVVYMTFTPLMGMTDTVKRFLIDKTSGTHVTTMTIYDAEHYTPERREAIIASYPAHEREARVNGVPTLGSGRIFPIVEATITCEPMSIPAHWARIGGLDFGWDHPSAAVELCHDREADVIYVTKAHRQREQTPILFAATIKPWGDWLPWMWPHDGLQHEKGSGEQLAKQYADQGLKMHPKHATSTPDETTDPPQKEGEGGNRVEPELLSMLDYMQTGRFKVFSNLADWFEEFRMYHRKDGKIVKLDDDLMAATRYAFMMRRHAITRPAPFKAISYGSRRMLA